MQSIRCTMRRISKKDTTGFEEFRKFMKHGQDFTKELSGIMQERAELDALYAKSLSKLAAKLAKAGKEFSATGSISNTWAVVADGMEAEAEIHRVISVALGEEVVKPLKSLAESQCRVRKGVEAIIDKSTKSLSEWRVAEAKAKAKCYLCCKENEKAQNKAPSNGSSVLSPSTSSASTSEKELTKVAKAELRKKKAAECVRRADLEYYSFCLRAERARSDWEMSVNKGANCFLTLEEERLACLKESAFSYHRAIKDIGAKLQWGIGRVGEALSSCDMAADLEPVKVMKIDSEGHTEQLLPDFYAEDMTNAMNRDRRKEVLRKFLGMLVQDLTRERKGKEGMENLVRAMTETPKLVTNGATTKEDALEKLKHIRTMVTYLEAAKYKVKVALAEAEGSPVADMNQPLAKCIHVQKDKQGFVQSVLKMPANFYNDDTAGFDGLTATQWLERERGMGDGTPSSPTQDELTDDFSSQGEESLEYQHEVLNGTGPKSPRVGPNQTASQSRHHHHHHAPQLQHQESVRRKNMAPSFPIVGSIPEASAPPRRLSSGSEETWHDTTDHDQDQDHGMGPSGVGSGATSPGSTPSGSTVTSPVTERPLEQAVSRCKVLYDYEAQHPDELTIQPGDIIEILQKQEDGWWHGNVDGAIGIFPSTYVEEI